MRNSIELNLTSVPDDCVKELERMFMDCDTDFPCRIGKVTFNASMASGRTVYKFGDQNAVSFSFHMNAGSFRISDPAEISPLDAIDTMTRAMGWCVSYHSVNEYPNSREVHLCGVKGHANIPDLIEALDSGLLVYKLRVIDAETKIIMDVHGLPDGRIDETLTLKFGW